MNNDNLLMDELKQDVERERWLAIWSRYRVVILGAVALVILATGAHSYWNYYTAQKNVRLTDALYNTITPDSATKPDDTAAALSSFAASNSGTAAAFMAEMQAAGLLLNADNKDGAAAHLQAALAMEGVDDNLRAVATLQYVQVVMETAKPEQLMEKLQPYIADASPYRFQAWELTALAAHRAGDAAKAQRFVQKILDDKDAPATARTRAQNLQRVLK